MLSPENTRLATLAAALFTMSYTGVAWVMADTPVSDTRNFPLQVALLPSMPASTGSISKPRPPNPPTSSALVAQPRPAQPAALPAGDGHPQRDRLRLAALQASTDYAITPCDEAAKGVMIRAVSSYAQAWADMMGCGPDGCDYKKINATAATFSTPLDIRLRETIGAAFDKRGISIDDFPSTLRINVAMLVRGRGAPATACPQARAQASR
jgi:hypothetical protein